jgi:hypothetical protein
MSTYTTNQTRKYEVVKAHDGWAVERAGQVLDSFAAADAAISHACRAAREDARRGWLGMVTTQTTPQEFHCYTPAQAARPAARPVLRLVARPSCP